MSRLTNYKSNIEAVEAEWDQTEKMEAFLLNELNISMAMIADCLTQIEGYQRKISRELEKRR